MRKLRDARSEHLTAVPAPASQDENGCQVRGNRRKQLKGKIDFIIPRAMRLIQLVFCVLLVLGVRTGFGQTIGKDLGNGAQLAAVKLLQEQIGLDSDLPNERNPKGLRIQFQKIGDFQPAEGHTVRYRLLIPGAPEHQSYFLEVWRIGTEVQVTPQQVYTNAKGLVMWHAPRPDEEKKDSLGSKEEIEVDLRASRGEPIRYILVSPDGKFLFPGTVVPYPVESTNNNCHMEARLGFPDADGILVYIDGLTPNSAVPLQVDSGSGTQSPHVIADEKGHAVAVVAPMVPGNNAGVAKISMVIKACSVRVEIPWGDGSYRPL
jgi:hypothetical protein